ncbi:transposable element Tcb1 transposase [Trichonephila clavipes]|uniref:Transposable element Tcb1 transposase n=1 Tax=Trichonephila clavipes TaxID=2585209 RepID=A0A8X6S1W9_TRICX|nr:transposable element Tcb1 transposase [Trichonephila clavipes]
MSFTRRPGSGRPRQTSRREDRNIVRNARVQSTVSSAAIQAQVAPSLGAPVSSRTIRRRLAEGHLGSWHPLRVLLLTLTHRRLRTIFQQDNARPHTARVSQDYLRTVLPFLGLPDSQVSPIENIWDHFGRRVGHLTSLNELEARLEQIWNEMSKDIIQSLYASMPNRIASCICARWVQQGIKSSILLPFSLK